MPQTHSGVVKKDRRELLRAAATSMAAGATVAILLTMLADTAISAQDKYTLQVPKGLSFSEFTGYEDWQTVAVSQTADTIKVILANQMIDADRVRPNADDREGERITSSRCTGSGQPRTDCRPKSVLSILAAGSNMIVDERSTRETSR